MQKGQTRASSVRTRSPHVSAVHRVGLFQYGNSLLRRYLNLAGIHSVNHCKHGWNAHSHGERAVIRDDCSYKGRSGDAEVYSWIGIYTM